MNAHVFRQANFKGIPIFFLRFGYTFTVMYALNSDIRTREIKLDIPMWRRLVYFLRLSKFSLPETTLAMMLQGAENDISLNFDK